MIFLWIVLALTGWAGLAFVVAVGIGRIAATYPTKPRKENNQ